MLFTYLWWPTCADQISSDTYCVRGAWERADECLQSCCLGISILPWRLHCPCSTQTVRLLTSGSPFTQFQWKHRPTPSAKLTPPGGVGSDARFFLAPVFSGSKTHYFSWPPQKTSIHSLDLHNSIVYCRYRKPEANVLRADFVLWR